jgi:hypothetical protein
MYNLYVFENMVLKGIFGPMRKVTGGWRKCHNEELCLLADAV